MSVEVSVGKVKVVHHIRHGAYSTPREAIEAMGLNAEDADRVPRHDPRLVAIVEGLIKRDRASGQLDGWHHYIAIAEIDADRYWISEYDGAEEVMTPDSIPWVEVGS